ncbi:MAG: DUF1294 domain-containing protein [Clostridiales bacterium]|nr:DUF1294 domain-containing protein [Clostridiales bacterium]
MGSWIWLYLAIINVAGFAVMGADKRRARRGGWRIPERTLFAVALAGGSLGALLGMRLFHHKTRHWYFVIGVPLILALQIILAFFLCRML